MTWCCYMTWASPSLIFSCMRSFPPKTAGRPCIPRRFGMRSMPTTRDGRLNAACDTLLQFLQYLINGEARCLLARGVILERCQEPGHEMLRRHEKVNVIEVPVKVGIGGDMCK